MTPISFMIGFTIGGALYHLGKSGLTGSPFNWNDWATSVYWTGFAAFMVWMGWLKQ